MRYIPKHPPSRDMRHVICDVCGFKFHMKDTVKINDKYNRLYGLIVCKADADRTNAQDRPFNLNNETIIANPTYVRPRQDLTYIANSQDDRVPGAPTNGQALSNPFYSYIDLYWDAPTDNGSSPITGYIVQRAEPQLSTYVTVVSDTETSSTYYSDTSADIATSYSFRVAAINGFGTGAYSPDFFWPSDENMWHDINYLVLSQDSTQIVTTSDGIPIRLNHTEAGVI